MQAQPVYIIRKEKMASHQEDKHNDEQRTSSYDERLGLKEFILKYIWTDQNITKKNQEALSKLDNDSPLADRLLLKHRRLVGFAIPAAVFHFFWWAFMIQQNQWSLFDDKYKISITMVFGSLIAGMTSVGGGAIAFPVMTLVFAIAPSISRDFTLMIQSCGMSAASFTIFFMRIQLEWNCLVSCSLGGVAGVVFGFNLVDPHLTPQAKKMGFVCIWFAYSFVLAFINFYRKQKTFNTISNFNWWRLLSLLMTGFVGGCFTSISGSGLDICSFSIMTLVFRITERVATPTSVVLMATNSVVGFCWRGIVVQQITTEALEFLAVCVPIVVIGAPIGSVLGSHFQRMVLVILVVVINTASLIGAFTVVKPMTPTLIGASVGILVLSIGVFSLLAFGGHKLRGENQSADDEEGNLPSPAVDGEKLCTGQINPAFINDASV